MAEFAKVYKRIWNSPRFINLTQDSQYLYLYLLTNVHTNMIGFYVLPIEYIFADTKIKPLPKPLPKGLPKGFDELLEKGFINHDFNARVILIKKWFKYNKIENPNQAKKALAEFSELPETNLIDLFINNLQEYKERLHKQFLEGLPKPLPKGLPKGFGKPEAEAEAVTEAKIHMRFFNKIFWPNYPCRNGAKRNKARAFELLCQIPIKKLPKVKKALFNYIRCEDTKKGIGVHDPDRFFLFRGKPWWTQWIDMEIKEEVIEKTPHEIECEENYKALQERMKRNNGIS